ncbi:hypothetical protein EN788_51525 [Mesorhizobium sp. M2D.F.Ca.ET.145.01.1.1]|nr:hypothetical protein EN788_51525 [Mesorhizobium sp. M2D.F.Ca.ET.145.01.1.1]
MAKHPGIVSIVKEMGSPVSRIHTQVEKLFRANGWEVMSGAAFGVTKADNGILITTRSGDQSTEQAQIVMNAFATAGLAFERRRQPVAPPNAMNTPELEILFTDF